MILALASVLIAILLLIAFRTILLRVPHVSSVSESEISRLRRRERLLRYILQLASVEQRILFIKLLVRTIHRLRIVSLKLEALTGRLLSKLRSRYVLDEGHTINEESVMLEELLDHYNERALYKRLGQYYMRRAKERSESRPEEPQARVTIKPIS